MRSSTRGGSNSGVVGHAAAGGQQQPQMQKCAQCGADGWWVVGCEACGLGTRVCCVSAAQNIISSDSDLTPCPNCRDWETYFDNASCVAWIESPGIANYSDRTKKKNLVIKTLKAILRSRRFFQTATKSTQTTADMSSSTEN